MPPTPQETSPELAQILGLIGEIKVDIEKGEQKFVTKEDLAKSTKSIEDWIKAVEKKQNEANQPGYGAAVEANALKSVIPARHLKCLERYARTTMKQDRAVRTVAMESWMKNAIMLHNPPVAARIGDKLIAEMDAIEKALGFDPTDKSEQRAAMQEDQSTEGGYLVPAPLEAEILRIAEDRGLLRNLCRVFPMSVKSHNFPDLQTNVTVALVPEEGTISTSEPTTGQKQLTARKFAVRAITSMELVQDSAIGIMSLLMELITEKYELKEDQQGLEGIGAGSEFWGVGSAAGVNEVVNTPDGALFTPAKVIEQKFKGRKQATRRNAAWIMAPEIIQQIESFRVDAVAAADKAGGFLYTPFMGGPGAGQILSLGQGPAPDGVLHGFPCYSHSEIAINRTVGSGTNCSNIYFGPWRDACILGDLLGILFGVSEHTQWATGQLDLRMIKRTAFLVGLPAAMTKQTGVKIA